MKATVQCTDIQGHVADLVHAGSVHSVSHLTGVSRDSITRVLAGKGAVTGATAATLTSTTVEQVASAVPDRAGAARAAAVAAERLTGFVDRGVHPRTLAARFRVPVTAIDRALKGRMTAGLAARITAVPADAPLPTGRLTIHAEAALEPAVVAETLRDLVDGGVTCAADAVRRIGVDWPYIRSCAASHGAGRCVSLLTDGGAVDLDTHGRRAAGD